MSLIKVTRTVLVEETITYNTSIPIPLSEQVMEDGADFEHSSILLEGEIEDKVFGGNVYSVLSSKQISKPQIIKIEKL